MIGLNLLTYITAPVSIPFLYMYEQFRVEKDPYTVTYFDCVSAFENAISLNFRWGVGFKCTVQIQQLVKHLHCTVESYP